MEFMDIEQANVQKEKEKGKETERIAGKEKDFRVTKDNPKDTDRKESQKEKAA